MVCQVVPDFPVRAIPARPTPLAKTILPLTGIRALAAGWVVAGHFKSHLLTLFPSLGFLDPLLTAGFLGVDLFFALSGFILAHNYLMRFQTVHYKPYLKFLGLRLARIYPVHVFTLLVLLAGVYLGKMGGIHFNMPQRLGLVDFFHNLLIIHAWTPRHLISWNGPAWSISAEWFAYLLFPLWAGRLLRVSTSSRAFVYVTLCFAILLGVFALDYDHPLIRIMCEFVAGCMLYRVYSMNWAAKAPWPAITTGVIILQIILIYRFPAVRNDYNRPLTAPLMAFLVLAIARSRGLFAAFLSSWPMIFLGEASYSLYMTHDLVRMSIPKLVPAARFADAALPVRLLVALLYVGTLFGVMTATYLLVEVTCRRRLRDALFGVPSRQARQISKAPPEQEPVLAAAAQRVSAEP